MNKYDQIDGAIKTLYELYKIDWMQRISPERQQDAIKNYFEEMESEGVEYSNSNKECSFSSYIEAVGYDGEIYACFDEFCDNELEDKDYIYGLIGDCSPLKEAYNMYLLELEKAAEDER